MEMRILRYDAGRRDIGKPFDGKRVGFKQRFYLHESELRNMGKSQRAVIKCSVTGEWIEVYD